MQRLTNVRTRQRPRIWKVRRYVIDGPQLERWFLKTLINISCDGPYPIGRNSHQAGRPTDELVRIAYGQSAFSERAGLYFVVQIGQRVDSDDTLLFSPLVKDTRHIEGGLFLFRGFRFLLFLEPDRPPQPLTGVSLNGEDWGQCQFNFHNQEIREFIGKYLSQIATIKW